MNAPLPPAPAPAVTVQTGLTGAGSNLARVIAAGHLPVCVEVSPPVGPNIEAIQREIKTLKGYGDAYNVTDNQSAMVHVSSLAVGIMLKQAGMEPVVQFACSRPQPPGHPGGHPRRDRVRHQHHPVPLRRSSDLGRSSAMQGGV